MRKQKNANRIRLSTSDRILDTVVMTMLIIFLLIILYPLIFIVSSSFSSGQAVSSGKVLLWPVDFSIEGYRLVFDYDIVWTGYKNTIFYTVVGTTLNVIVTILAAYPLSRRNMQGRDIYATIFMIPMFIGGGLIPTYLLMSNLKLTNTPFVILLSGLFSIYNMVIMRTFFQNSVPADLHEAAKIDGITDIGYLLKILLPLSKPVLAVIALYYAVGHWNNYFTGLIYLRDRDLMPLQLVLRDILTATQIDSSMVGNAEEIAAMIGASDVMKYSLIIVSTVPILVLYPFIQKFFEKGVMLGSVKG